MALAERYPGLDLIHMKKLFVIVFLLPVLLFGQSNPGYDNIKGSNNVAVTVTGTGNAKRLWIDDHWLAHPPTTNGASGYVLAYDPTNTNTFWTPQTIGLVTNSFTIVTNLTVINNLYVSNEFVTNIIVQTEFVTNLFVINNSVLSNLFLTNGSVYINGVSNLANINPTVRFIPYNLDGTNFADSPLVRIATNKVTLTNQFGAIAEFDVAGNTSAGQLKLITSTAGASVQSLGGLNLTAATGAALQLASGSDTLFFISKTFYGASNDITGGNFNVPFKDWFSRISTLMGVDGTTNALTGLAGTLYLNGIPIGGSGFINPTVNFIPYRQSGTNFGDSPFRVIGPGLVGLTNSTSGVAELVFQSSNKVATFGIANQFGLFQLVTPNGMTLDGSGSSISIKAGDQWQFFNGTLTPGVSNTYHLGQITRPFADLWFPGTVITATNGTVYANGVPIGGGSQTPWLSDIDAAHFSLSDAKGVSIAHATNSSGSTAVADIGLAIANMDQSTNVTATGQRAGLAVGWFYQADDSHILAQDAIAVGSFEGATFSQIESYDGSYAGGQLDVANTTTVSSFNGGIASGNYIASVGATVIASAGLAMGYGFGANTPMVEAFNGSIAAGIVANNEVIWATNGSLSMGQDVASFTPLTFTFGEHGTNIVAGSLALVKNGATVHSLGPDGYLHVHGLTYSELQLDSPSAGNFIDIYSDDGQQSFVIQNTNNLATTGQLTGIQPTIGDGATPYFYDTFVNHTSGQIATFQNFGTNVFTINFDGSITTGNPGSGIASWKLGKVVTGAVTSSVTNYVEVDIAGTLVKLVKAN